MSKLLMDEAPLTVSPSLAAAIGVNAAIVLQQVHYWLKIAERGKDTSKLKDGKWWTYNTHQQWQEQFPWLSESGIRKVLNQLRERGLIETAKHGKRGQDHTLWYTIDYEAVGKLGEPSATQGHIKCHSGSVDVSLSDESYATESTPETSTETLSPEGADATEKSKKQKSPEDHTGKLIDDLEELGFFLDRKDVAKVSGNFGKLKSKGVSHSELVRVRQRMVAEWPRIQLSPQQALADIRSQPRGQPPEPETERKDMDWWFGETG